MKCQNRTSEKCRGEFVLTFFDVCYFFYKTLKVFRNFEKVMKNQSVIEYSSPKYVDAYYYIDNIFSSLASSSVDAISQTAAYHSWNYLSSFLK